MFSPQSIEMSSQSHTSLSDHCNSVPRSASVIHVERNWSTYDFIHNRKRNRLTEARAHDLVYVHSNLKLSQKLQSLEYQEANIECERWAVSDSDNLTAVKQIK